MRYLINFTGLDARIFIILKLCGVITWSWWWLLLVVFCESLSEITIEKRNKKEREKEQLKRSY